MAHVVIAQPRYIATDEESNYYYMLQYNERRLFESELLAADYNFNRHQTPMGYTIAAYERHTPAFREKLYQWVSNWPPNLRHVEFGGPPTFAWAFDYSETQINYINALAIDDPVRNWLPEYFLGRRYVSQDVRGEVGHRLVEEWNTTEDRLREYYAFWGVLVGRPREFNLPRGADENVLDLDRLGGWRTEIPEDEHERFAMFVYGFRIVFPRRVMFEPYASIWWQETNAWRGDYRWEQVFGQRSVLIQKGRDYSEAIGRAFLPHYFVGKKENARPTPADLTHVHDKLREIQKPGAWKFAKTVYANAQGTPDAVYSRIIYLLLQIDDSDSIQQRLVVKVQGYGTRERAATSLRQEVGVHTEVTKCGCSHILDCFGSSLRERQTLPRGLSYIYMDYAPFGDLHSLMKTYQRLGKNIPEVFIWLIFRGLAEALFVLATGQKEEDVTYQETTDPTKLPRSTNRSRWKPLVHIDIKPMNIVLGDPTTQYPAFKTAKLIDFGLCLPHDKIPRPSKDDMFEQGTRGYRPPEMHENFNTFTTRPISGWADIYCVGLVILGLMNKANITLDAPDTHPKNGKPTWSKLPGFPDTYNTLYTGRLVRLAEACVTLNPTKRPLVTKLLKETQAGLNAYLEVYGQIAQKDMKSIRKHHRMQDAFPSSSDPFRKGHHVRIKKRARDDGTEEEDLEVISRSKRKSVAHASAGPAAAAPPIEPDNAGNLIPGQVAEERASSPESSDSEESYEPPPAKTPTAAPPSPPVYNPVSPQAAQVIAAPSSGPNYNPFSPQAAHNKPAPSSGPNYNPVSPQAEADHLAAAPSRAVLPREASPVAKYRGRLSRHPWKEIDDHHAWF